MHYEKPEIELIQFNSADIVTVSQCYHGDSIDEDCPFDFG